MPLAVKSYLNKQITINRIRDSKPLPLVQLISLSSLFATIHRTIICRPGNTSLWDMLRGRWRRSFQWQGHTFPMQMPHNTFVDSVGVSFRTVASWLRNSNWRSTKVTVLLINKSVHNGTAPSTGLIRQDGLLQDDGDAFQSLCLCSFDHHGTRLWKRCPPFHYINSIYQEQSTWMLIDFQFHIQQQQELVKSNWFVFNTIPSCHRLSGVTLLYAVLCKSSHI